MLEIFEHWREFPTTRMLVRAFVGYKPPTKAQSPEVLETAMQDRVVRAVVGNKRETFDQLPVWIQQDLIQKGIKKL